MNSIMDVTSSGRKLARKLFESPTKHYEWQPPCNSDGSSSDADTIGPMSPLTSPARRLVSQSPKRLFELIARRSPRIARQVLCDTTLISDSDVSPTEKTPLNSQSTILSTPSKVLGKTKKKPENIVVEESPDILSETLKKKEPAVKQLSKERVFSPSSGFSCGSFYQKPKARLSLFADFVSKTMSSNAGKKRSRSASSETRSQSSRREKNFKRPRMTNFINKNVRHGIKKPKPKASKQTKKPLTITPVKKLPLITPRDRLNNFMDSSELDELMAEMKNPKNPNDMEILDYEELDDADLENKQEILPSKLESPKADPKKKFFKTNRTMEINRTATVTLDSNIKFQVSNGKITLQKPVVKTAKNPLKLRRSPKTAIEFEHLEETVTEKKVHLKVERILDALDDILPVESKENNVAVANCITSPSLRMDAITSSTSKMAIATSPVSTTPTQAGNEEKTLFPLFYKGRTPLVTASSPTRQSPRGVKRAWIGQDQYQLDAGQRRFGATQCSECHLVYTMGEPDEEDSHQAYHNSYRYLKYTGWKNERVVNTYDSNRVIVVTPSDPKAWWNKVSAVLEVVDKELGFVDTNNLHNLAMSKVFMYIADNRVVGCLVSQPASVAYKMLTDIPDIDCCSEESYPIKCGVSRIWTAQDWRRKKVASRLVDCMRLNFMFGGVLSQQDYAFSVPTVSGKEFAKSYTSCPQFLVYLAPS